jgi:hypothetical protein
VTQNGNVVSVIAESLLTDTCTPVALIHNQTGPCFKHVPYFISSLNLFVAEVFLNFIRTGFGAPHRGSPVIDDL